MSSREQIDQRLSRLRQGLEPADRLARHRTGAGRGAAVLMPIFELDGDLHVVVTNGQGLRRERDFTGKKPVRKVWKKTDAQANDDEGAKATDGVVDGGLGRCITLAIQMIVPGAGGKKRFASRNRVRAAYYGGDCYRSDLS